MTRKSRPTIGSRLTGLVAGVDALAQPATTTLNVDELVPGQFQPRTYFDDQALAELARSIQEQGILQPLLVRPAAGGNYEIVAGERRWRAAKQAGLRDVPVLIRPLSDADARMASAVENLQREDLNVIEEVRARLQVAAATLNVLEKDAVARMFALDRQPDSDPQMVARLDTHFAALGRETWRSFIRNRAAVLNLPDDVQEAVRSGLDYRKALVIGRVGEARKRRSLMEKALAGETVENLRAAVSGPKTASTDPWQTVTKRLSDKKVLAKLDDTRRKKVEKLLQQIQQLLDE